MFNIAVLLVILGSQGDAACPLSHHALCHRKMSCLCTLLSYAIPASVLQWLFTATAQLAVLEFAQCNPTLALSLAPSFIPILTVDSLFSSVSSNIWASHLFAYTILILSVSYPSLKSYLTLPASSVTFFLWLFSSWDLAFMEFSSWDFPSIL